MSFGSLIRHRNSFCFAISVIVGTLVISDVRAEEKPTLPIPIQGTEANPVVVLFAAPQETTPNSASLVTSTGEVIDKSGVDYVAASKGKLNVVKKGLAPTGVTWRFALKPQPPEGDYHIAVRYACGGEPHVVGQTFHVRGGPSEGRMEERGKFTVTNPSPWKAQWIDGRVRVAIKADDAVLEIRNEGRAHDAKIFEAFLLVPTTLGDLKLSAAAPPATPVSSASEMPKTSAGQQHVVVPLPIVGTAARPTLLLEAEPTTTPPNDPHTFALPGAVVDHSGDDYTTPQASAVNQVHKGFGNLAITFRYELPPRLPTGEYFFWARWSQGGDPKVCGQQFEIWAGPTVEAIELRSKQTLRPGGWNANWFEGQPLTLKADDRVLEIRNRGNAQDAKIFDAFLLCGPKPPVELPLAGTTERPIVVLGFGKEPLRKPHADPKELAYLGKLVDRPGADAGNVGKDVALVVHKGFGEWGAVMQFDLQEPIPPGFYTFQARFMCGGEPSQTRQTFSVLAGPDEQSLGERATFQLANPTPFKQQWIAGKGVVPIFPGDRVVRIVNRGKAHDAKVFSGFVLGPSHTLPDWMTAERGLLRSRFLAMALPVENAEQRLFLVDGDGPGETELFAGLSQPSAASHYERLAVTYLIGREADAFAEALNLPGRPAAVMVNADRAVSAVLHAPPSVDVATRFLAAPRDVGIVPSYPDRPQPTPRPLADGVPAEWLTATGWPGRCGVGRWGLDAEAQQRPNPGETFGYSFYTAGVRSGTWREKSTSKQGVCRIDDQLAESFAWGKATSYAVVYLRVDQPADAVLHYQHSGIESAVFLDGVAQTLRADAQPPFTLSRQTTTTQQVVARPGQEIHDDVTVPQSAQPPQAANLSLTPGWHCLVLKFVHAQSAGETVLFTARVTKPDGSAVNELSSQTVDPTVVPALNHAAAQLWPRLTLEDVPGNLPRPGERLSLVADMRLVPSFVTRYSNPTFLPFDAVLNVRMTDYDGRELGSWQNAGTFPSVMKFDLGPAPEAGYYALTPELRHRDGRLIHRFHPDGFSVVLGNTAQRERLEKKELLNSWYYALGDWDTFAPWLERMGLFKNLGSTPGVPANAVETWRDAQRRGIVLYGDFAGDSTWMNNSEADAKKVVDTTSKYTRYFKSVNEIDGRVPEQSWSATTKPEQWVKRARWQYEAVHAARADALFVGGSLYCSGVSRRRHAEMLSPREWFRACLELGLDNYVDAWDVHAYPQSPPRLDAPSLSNSGNESDLGVLSVFQELGKKNTKPFILGETSALVWHGMSGMRWQADTAAKMAAWTNARAEWLGVAFCAAHHDRRLTAEEYGMAHNPGEAALYTASALIDGLPYERISTEDVQVQVGKFGPTRMIWRTDDKATDWTFVLDEPRPWVVVDVVGRARSLEVVDGRITIKVRTSPQYLLPRAEYERLTRLDSRQ